MPAQNSLRSNPSVDAFTHPRTLHDFPPKETAYLNQQEAIHKLAFQQFGEAKAIWDNIYSQADLDMNFLAGNQWEDSVIRNRTARIKPTLTFNILRPQVMAILAQYSDNNFSISFNPVEKDFYEYKDMSGAHDFSLSQIYNSIFQHIARTNNFEAEILQAAFQQLATGIAFMRVYVESASMEAPWLKEIKIETITRPRGVMLDPQIFDTSELGFPKYGFVFTPIRRRAFKELYGVEYEHPDPSDETGLFNEHLKGDTEDVGMVCEYFRTTPKTRYYAHLVNGASICLNHYETGGRKPEEIAPMVAALHKSQLLKVTAHTIPVPERMVLYGNDKIASGPHELLTPFIPIVPFPGIVMRLPNGRVACESLIRHSLDAQAEFNLWRSVTAEHAAAAPPSKVILGAQGLKGQEAEWEKYGGINRYIPFNENTRHPPQVIGGIPPHTAELALALQAKEDTQETTGVYDAALGQRSNERTGRAISYRTSQALQVNSLFLKNTEIGLKQVAKLVASYIPFVYSEREQIRIRTPDSDNNVIALGGGNYPDIAPGYFDINIKISPKSETQRENMVSMLTELLQTSPETFQIVGDILMENLDFPGAEKIAQRIRRSMNPSVLSEQEAAEAQQGAAPPPPPGPEQQLELQKKELEVENEKTELAKNLVELSQADPESKALQTLVEGLAKAIGPMIQSMMSETGSAETKTEKK